MKNNILIEEMVNMIQDKTDKPDLDDASNPLDQPAQINLNTTD